jgi:GrpB-like predicted nucleotidyltransferase (UPF0157 family)
MEETAVLGLRYGVVKLAPHSPEWQNLFDIEHQILQGLIGPYVIEIRHIGSTAIPSIYAKPILDIMAGLRKLADIEHCIAPLETAGYNTWENRPSLVGISSSKAAARSKPITCMW